jgi:NAD(P) transhydrogenase subunit beta
MLLAIVATLLASGLSYGWIILGMAIGTGIGLVAAYRVEMTQMPEMVALFNGFGGISSLLLAWAEYHQHREMSLFIAVVAFLSAFIG